MATTATATKERPILFSGPMVRAILDGRKTQTRRVVKGAWALEGDESGCGWEPPACPYGEPGDRLWVREAWGLMDTQPSDGPDRATLGYRADGDAAAPNGRHQLWRPSIHMPRWASRITLEITDVRVERLRSISREDVRAEGIPETFGDWGALRFPGFEAHVWDNMRFDEQWKLCWDQINGDRPGCSWDANPWVWAITFRRIES